MQLLPTATGNTPQPGTAAWSRKEAWRHLHVLQYLLHGFAPVSLRVVNRLSLGGDVRAVLRVVVDAQELVGLVALVVQVDVQHRDPPAGKHDVDPDVVGGVTDDGVLGYHCRNRRRGHTPCNRSARREKT